MSLLIGALDMRWSPQLKRLPTFTSALVVLAAIGCTSDPPRGLSKGQTEASIQYHPDNDPLINPPEMFEEFDPERGDTDATLTRHLIGEPATLHPIFVNSWFDFYMQRLLYGYLFGRDHNLEYVPSAERVAIKCSVDNPKHAVTMPGRDGAEFRTSSPQVVDCGNV